MPTAGPRVSADAAEDQPPTDPTPVRPPAFLAQRKALKPGLSAADIARNEFNNPTIGLPTK